MRIDFNQFLGANSDIGPNSLPVNCAIEATNVFTDQGALDTWNGLNHVGVDPVWNGKTGILKSLFLMNNSRWLAWSGTTNAALLQMANNADWQLAFTDTVNGPQYTSLSLAVAGGGTTYPNLSYPLGVPAPATTLTVTTATKATPANTLRAFWQVAGTVADTVGNRIAKTYVYTFVNSQGREGPPSNPSLIAYSNDDEQNVLSGFQAIPNADITKIRIYVASSGGTFNYLTEIAATTSPYTITDNTFGAAITTITYTPPPTGLLGLVSMANGMLAGYVGNNLYFSEPYQSHAWPEDYITAMDYPIQGLASIGNMLYIATQGYPVIAVGNTPAFMSYTKLNAIQANYSNRSLVNMGSGTPYTVNGVTVTVGSGAMYASRDGIVLMSSGNASMASDGIISERVYQLMVPSSIHAYYYRDKYIGFYDSGLTGSITASTGEIIPAKGAFILDPKRRTVSYTDVYCDTAFSDKVSGKLYLCINQAGTNNLFEWNEGSTNLQQAWKSLPVLTEPMYFSVARVVSERYPLTFQLYADDTVILTKTVTSKTAFRLPSATRYRKWMMRVSGDAYIQDITLATSIAELMQQ